MKSIRLVALLVTLCALSFAQVTASFSGRVLDATGSPVGAAAVTVKSLETGAVRLVNTDMEGNYHAVSVPLGSQEIKVEKQGFKVAVRAGVNLTVGQDAVVNFTLEVGELAQQVTVTEDVPIINTTTASVSGVVGARDIKDLPINGRSFDKLITLNPGAINYGLRSPGTSTSNGSTFSVAGRRPADNIVMMNGIEYTGSSQLAITPGGVSGELLGIDAVREFNVLTDTYSAEYGKRAGAQVSVVTQSGSNTVHGSLFEFVRNSAFDARNFFDQGNVPPFRRNQFGGALGGPVMKDKLFLFGNYEGFRQSLAVSNVSVVPNAQARLGRLPTNGVYAPVTNLNPAMLKYMQMWPEANGPELLSNGQPTGTALSYNNPRQSIHEDFGTIRLDYHPREKDSFSAAWTVDDGNAVIPQADPLFGSGNVLRNQVASAEALHVFSPNTINTMRVGFSRAAFNYNSITLKPFPADLSFVAGADPGGIVIGGGATTTGIASLTAAGPNNAANVWNRRNLYTVTDTLQTTRGRHQISVGGWFQRVQDN
ncbi:MAG: TonB-dependent receptor, partial [Bryobacterales bacterium]|nr:TonB-dependent receptor [Bryobacterales bacterium]